MRVRSEHSKKNKYYLPKHRYMTVYHYALQYSEWKNEYNTLQDSAKAIRYDLDKVQTSQGMSDATFELAMRRVELKAKMESIENIVQEVAPELYKYLLIGVTQEGMSFNYLHYSLGMPCSQYMYNDRRGAFYYRLSVYLEEKEKEKDERRIQMALLAGGEATG